VIQHVDWCMADPTRTWEVPATPASSPRDGGHRIGQTVGLRDGAGRFRGGPHLGSRPDPHRIRPYTTDRRYYRRAALVVRGPRVWISAVPPHSVHSLRGLQRKIPSKHVTTPSARRHSGTSLHSQRGKKRSSHAADDKNSRGRHDRVGASVGGRGPRRRRRHFSRPKCSRLEDEGSPPPWRFRRGKTNAKQTIPPGRDYGPAPNGHFIYADGQFSNGTMVGST